MNGRRILILAVALLVLIAGTQVAQAAVKIHKTCDADLKVWNTFMGWRVGPPIYTGSPAGCTTITVNPAWWATDILVWQKLSRDDATVIHNVGALLQVDPNLYVMEELEAWKQAHSGFEPLVLPDVIINEAGWLFDTHVAIDINEWHSEDGNMPATGTTIYITDGSAEELPGYLIGTTPITFDPNEGWVNPNPLDESYVEVVGDFNFTAPGSTFVFDFNHVGVITQDDPCWVGPKNPKYPFQHIWELVISNWPSDVEYVSDIDIEEPWVIYPGYIEVVPPENWSSDGVKIGRYDYDANPGSEISAGGGSLGIDWRVNGKTPAVVQGHVVLTWKEVPVSPVMETMIVAPEGTPPVCSPFVMLDTFDDWQRAMQNGEVGPVDPLQWEDHMLQWNEYYDHDGNNYPTDTNFYPADGPSGGLWVYEGNSTEPEYPNDAGLVMGWGEAVDEAQFPQGLPQASAWQMSWPRDPDLRNCIITVSVTAPQFPMAGPGAAINQVSFGLQNNPMVGGPMRAWFWNCGPAVGPGIQIAWNTPTTITIDTSTNVANPPASGFMSNPGFNLANVQWTILDENGTWVGGPNPTVPPGGPPTFLWNYWHWMMITPKTRVTKGYYTKWSQPPVVVDPNDDPPVIIGWDEPSDYNDPNIVADDWLCKDDRPVTDIHWWGSFIGWNKPHPPPIVPKAFQLGIWTDDPCSGPGDFSHPNDLIWENYCDNWVWNFSGYDRDPRLYLPGAAAPNAPGFDEPMDTCFQFNQLLSEDEWFFQEPNDPCDGDPNATVYWLSIAAVYNTRDYSDPNYYPWGWKTRRPEWNDDAVRINSVMDPATGGAYWPPVIGCKWNSGTPIKWPDTPEEWYSWDVCFELTTNEPGPLSADLNHDGIVNLRDLAALADQYLMMKLNP